MKNFFLLILIFLFAGGVSYAQLPDSLLVLSELRGYHPVLRSHLNSYSGIVSGEKEVELISCSLRMEDDRGNEKSVVLTRSRFEAEHHAFFAELSRNIWCHYFWIEHIFVRDKGGREQGRLPLMVYITNS